MPNALEKTTPKKTVRTAVVEDILVSVFTAEAPSDEEWDAGIAHLAQHGDNIKGAFTITKGGAPNARQRKKLWVLAQKHNSYKASILSTSVVVRMVVTALNLFLQNQLKVFAPHELQEALRYINVSAEEGQLILKTTERFQRELDI